jgi:hypothetical protein
MVCDTQTANSINKDGLCVTGYGEGSQRLQKNKDTSDASLNTSARE